MFSAVYGLTCPLLQLGGQCGEYAASPPRVYGTGQPSQHEKGCYLTLLWASSKCFFQLQEETRKGVVVHGEPVSHKACKGYIRVGQDIPYPLLDGKPSRHYLALVPLLLAVCAALCLFHS